MTHNTLPFRRRTLLFGAALAAVVGAPSYAQQPQVFFSVDYHGPTKSRPDSGAAVPITEGDILRRATGAGTFNVTAAPFTALTGGGIGITLYATCVGTVSGQPCGVEVDAISFGNEDRYPAPMAGQTRPRLYFSVDRFAQGLPTTFGTPSVRTEALGRDAASDVFTPVFDFVPPVAPGTVQPSNRLVFDGNGSPSTTGGLAPGLGLFEPHSLPPSPAADAGDNLDALSVGPLPTGPQAAIYYSLDGGFPDPNGVPNSNSAQLNGFSPAAVLRKLIVTGSPTVYASPSQLGLSPFQDDLDALILSDNGDGIFQPSQTPYDWVGPLTGGTDMLLYSVRRGSVVVGQTDSLLGLPIEPGDILTTPVAGGNGRPGIFIAAEALGLSTQRSGGPRDELDAIALELDPYFDCNMNGVEDSVDIGQGASNDSNNNGIPDECEQIYGRYCTCEAGLGPCGNDSPGTGCRNSTGVGATLDGVGTTSVTTDDLQMSAASMPAGTSTLFFGGPNQTQTPFGDGLRCVASPTYRLELKTASATGTATYGPGIGADLCTNFSQCMAAGSTFNFQVWYRNAAMYCTSATFNLTNGVTVTYTP
ncbi:MAG: hypothetical protein NTY35_14450 [Planctomycetota bacterium]|nr:hypothetical protein [Planctomycetota bacterium]